MRFMYLIVTALLGVPIFVSTQSQVTGIGFPRESVCNGVQIGETAFGARKGYGDGFGAAVLNNGDSEANFVLRQVASQAGLLLSSVTLAASPDVRNNIAIACEDKRRDGSIKRYIIYDPTILNELSAEVQGGWFHRAIFAHEVGHIVKNHNILAQRKVKCVDIPDANETSGKLRSEMELEADEFAGEILAKLGATLSEAQKSFERISTDDPDDGCYPSRDQRLTAVKRGWQRISGLLPGSDSYEKGYKALSTCDFVTAIEELSMAIGKNPSHAEAFNLRGAAYSLNGDRTKAFRDYQSAIDLKPDFTAPYFNRSILFSNDGSTLEKAIEDLTKIIQIRPSASQAYLERGRIRLLRKNYDDAIADLSMAIDRRFDDSRPFSNRGTALRKQGKYLDAIADFTEAIRRNPSDVDSYFNRALAYRSLRRFVEASADDATVSRLQNEARNQKPSPPKCLG